MDFKVTMHYQNQYGDHEYNLGHMSAPQVLFFFQHIDWHKEKTTFEEAALTIFPMIMIEDIAVGQVFQTRLNADANDLSFYSTCQIIESRQRFFGKFTQKRRHCFTAHAFALDNVALALSLFLAGDQQQLYKLYGILGQATAPLHKQLDERNLESHLLQPCV